MYGLFLQSLGYAKDLDLSELEIAPRGEGAARRASRTSTSALFEKDWAAEKGKVAFALGEASRVLHSLDPDTYPMADSWVKAVKNKADITPGQARRARGRADEAPASPGNSLMFVVDEVGQFVARDVQKMLDLQAVVQSLGVKGRGKHWVVVTSQEKLGELVSGLDDKKIELARLMDRFPLQVHLEPSDISEVTSRRVLSKNAAAQTALGKLFDEHRGRLTEHTRLTADIKLPELSREALHRPLPAAALPDRPHHPGRLGPAHAGRREQARRRREPHHHQARAAAAHQPGREPRRRSRSATSSRLDQVYDLVEGNIGSEVRAKIAAISKELEPPARAAGREGDLPASVREERPPHAPRTSRRPCTGSVGGDSQLASVKEALRELEAAHKVRHGDDGYRIPTPAEDDWERLRNGISPKPGDSHRLYSEVLSAFWQPQPVAHALRHQDVQGGPRHPRPRDRRAAT